MNVDEHIGQLGILLANLQGLELLLRLKLLRHEGGRFPKFLDIVEGHVLEKTALTDYRSLGELIEAYNRIAPANALVDRAVVRLRDALVHGRIVGIHGVAPTCRCG